MATLARRSFAQGWIPDADAVNAPPDGLLRMDNGILDELGAVAVRLGSAKINSCAFADTDVHSLFTVNATDGTRYRFAGAGASVYQNGSSIASSLAGLGDIAFGAYQGQVLFARSTTKKKTDGTTVRNWGIAMTGGAAAATGGAPDSKTFISGASTESPALVWVEDDGTGASYTTGYNGVANAAAKLHQVTATGRGVITKTFASPQDFTHYDGGATADPDNDAFEIYIYVTDPARLNGIRVDIDVNAGTFITDIYWANIAPAGFGPGVVGGFVEPIRSGWNRYSIQRQFFTPAIVTAGKDWSTVKAIRLFMQTPAGATDNPCYFQQARMYGGTNSPISGNAKWRYVYVFNSGTYQGKSAASPETNELALQAASGSVVVPVDASRDSQVNEIWLYRFDDALGGYFRSAVKTGVSGTGAYTIADVTSDADVLTIDLPLEPDNGPPPDTIIGIAGPYYDRVFALTATDLYPSRQLNPDSFAAGQVIHIAGADETALWVVKAYSGLFIGTTKDIYVLNGTGSEFPDGSIDFSLKPLNVDHPPRSSAFAQEGNQLIYLADDGWRAFTGQTTQPLAAATSLLYRGQTRHGISPVNLTGGRFKAAIVKGQFVAITPEGASTTAAANLYRFLFAGSRWYRHVYPQTFRSVFREPDGTLIAGDTAGFVRILDTGTQDDGADIAMTVWTRHDDDNALFRRKDPEDFRVTLDTGGNNAAIALHLDDSASAATTVTVSSSGVSDTTADISSIAAFRRLQLRITGSFSTFKLDSVACGYLELPPLMRGFIPQVNLGYQGEKTLSGLTLRLCTLAAQATFTPYFDGIAGTTFAITTADDEPSTLTIAFAAPTTCTDFTLSVDGDIELYAWTPIISTRRPLGIKAWDSGPLDLGDKELVWLREFWLKVRATGDLTITPYFDGVAFTAISVPVSPTGADLVIPIPIGRSYFGRQPRLVVTSSAVFYPYWMKILRRTSGMGSEKPVVTIPVTLETGT